MIDGCTGCLYDLGGGRDNCCLGVAAECPYAGGGSECIEKQLHRDAYAYIQQLEAQQPRWISVGERAQQNVSGRK